MTYYEAMRALTAGTKVRRQGWPYAMYVKMSENGHVYVYGHGTLGGDPVVWHGTGLDELAEWNCLYDEADAQRHIG
jgi:hypothetical protein